MLSFIYNAPITSFLIHLLIWEMVLLCRSGKPWLYYLHLAGLEFKVVSAIQG